MSVAERTRYTDDGLLRCGVPSCRMVLTTRDETGQLRWVARFRPNHKKNDTLEVDNRTWYRHQHGTENGRETVSLGGVPRNDTRIKCPHCGFVQTIVIDDNA